MESRERRNENVQYELMDIERILRKSLVENFKEFVENCSLAGVKQVFEPNVGLCQRIIWILVFLSAMGSCVYFLLYIWSDTLGKPLIVTMETPTYPISNVDFPAVAVCNFNRISKRVAQEVARKIHKEVAKNGETLEHVEAFILEWGRLIDFSYNESTKNHPVLTGMIEFYRNYKSTEFIVDFMKQLAPKCDEMLVRCGWDGTIVDCDRLFDTRRTTEGHCCTFNYVLDYTSDGRPHVAFKEIKRQKEAGFVYGLTVILDPLLDDYAYSLGHMNGFDILMYPATTYPDPRAGRVLQRVVQPDRAVFLELGSIRQYATNEVRKYNPKTRMCYFKDENQERYNGMYSYSGCIVNCRVNTLFSLCKCTPYFVTHYRVAADTRICNIEDLKCLNKYKEKLIYLYPETTDTVGLELEIQESLYCPQCLPDCEHTRIVSNSYDIPLYTIGQRHKDFENGFGEGVNLTGKSIMNVHFPVPDSILNRLDVVNYWYEVLSSIGGFGGIVMGFSLLCVIEIFYYGFIRFFVIFYLNYQKYRNQTIVINVTHMEK